MACPRLSIFTQPRATDQDNFLFSPRSDKSVAGADKSGQSVVKHSNVDELSVEELVSSDSLQRSHAKIWSASELSSLLRNSNFGQDAGNKIDNRQQDSSIIDDMLFSDEESTSSQ